MVKSLNWYAVYTKPRWEKKVNLFLQEKGIESYCPLNKVRKKWSDRYKIVEEPLFKSYVFVRIGESEMTAVKQVNGVLNYIYWNGKPARIKDQEINDIKSFLKDHPQVTVVPMEVKPFDKVKVVQGVFMGKDATVRKLQNNLVEIEIESLNFKLIAKVDKSNLEVL
jgi:transcription antitermination factor NusG